MKIQFLNGGLANQAFQYIFARYYELSHPGDVMYLDDTYFALNTIHNGYELEKVFGIHPHVLSECFDQPVWKFILETKRLEGKSVPQILSENQIAIQMISEVGEESQHFNPFDGERYAVPCGGYFPEILDVPGNIYYHGYWINHQWFDAYSDIFLKEFQFPEITDEKNRAYLEQITTSPSLAIHIRRGDYTTLGLAFSPEVCRQFVDTFCARYGKDWRLFVFSDDIPWCREHAIEMNFHQFPDYTFIEGNLHGENYRDMQLMSHCRALILSNSSFCYLAALLNPHKEAILNLTSRGL